MVFNHIKQFHPLSLCDWPGHPCPVLFLGGCNLACGTCHNGDLAWREKGIAGISIGEVLDLLEQRKKWYHGITITGGEPTIHKDLPSLLAVIKDRVKMGDGSGIPIKVDSNGTNPAMVRDLVESGLADSVAVDIKGPWSLYPALTNYTFAAEAAERKISEILEMSVEFPGKIYFRCTKVPVITSTPGAMDAVLSVVPAGVEFRFQDYVDPSNTRKSINKPATGTVAHSKNTREYTIHA